VTRVAQSAVDEVVHQVGLIELMRQGYLTDVRALRSRLNVDLGGRRRA
jgi:hypothetical protein